MRENSEIIFKRITMKTTITFCFAVMVLALSACSSTETKSDYKYENQAPYADERTVGTADTIFDAKQRK